MSRRLGTGNRKDGQVLTGRDAKPFPCKGSSARLHPLRPITLSTFNHYQDLFRYTYRREAVFSNICKAGGNWCRFFLCRTRRARTSSYRRLHNNAKKRRLPKKYTTRREPSAVFSSSPSSAPSYDDLCGTEFRTRFPRFTH